MRTRDLSCHHVTVLLTLTTTHEPATDLGYLLVKHPDRVHVFEVPTGTAYVCFPELSEQRCTAALILEVDPSRLASVRSGKAGPDGFTPSSFTLGRYVNDRPYAASSLLAGALNRAFKSAMRGDSRDRPEVAANRIPLEIRIPALRCRGGAELVPRLFGPLGWTVDTTTLPLDPTLDWGPSRYADVTLKGELRLADALNQLYVLLPVCDDAKHYWVAPDEVDKLLRAGAGWLVDHPERDLISRRYLSHRRGLAVDANTGSRPCGPPTTGRTGHGGIRPRCRSRRGRGGGAPTNGGATRRAAPACGPGASWSAAAPPECSTSAAAPGALLADLIRDKPLHRAGRGRRGNRGTCGWPSAGCGWTERTGSPNASAAGSRLLQSALTYTDDRLVGFDAAVLMEVIEHVDPPRLPALAATVFGHARPSTVVVTTPNVEYNVRYEGHARPERCATTTTGSSGPGARVRGLV